MSDDLSTFSASADDPAAAPRPVVVLTLLAHPDPARVGEWAAFGLEETLELSRDHPRFSPHADGLPRPLEDRFVSRKPVRLRFGDGLYVDASALSKAVSLNLEALRGRRRVALEDLKQGVVLVLASRVALVARLTASTAPAPAVEGLIGESEVVRTLRREIHRLAALPYNVLLRGESGAGKEIAARALHRLGSRRDGPFIARNMGALTPSLAAAELFGAAKGAFTDAGVREGAFRAAHEGTLMLDEIGVVSSEIQVMLLRALETGEIQVLGSDRTVRVDVRVISATDADLDESTARGFFSVALLNRLGAYEIRLPPLRESREDIGRLVYAFLREELEKIGAGDRLRAVSGREKPWIPADIIARFALADWPGNVRQLRNAVRRLVAAGHDVERVSLTPTLEYSLVSPEFAETDSKADRDGGGENYRRPGEVPREEIRSAMRRHGYEFKSAAEALGVSRTTLYALVEKYGLPNASDLSKEQIAHALELCGDDLQKTAEFLEVSLRSLRLRMRRLGLLDD